MAAVSKKTKIMLSVLALLIVGAIALFIHTSHDPLADLKKYDVVKDGTAQEEAFIKKVLDLIEKDDMDNLYRNFDYNAQRFYDVFATGFFKEEPKFTPAHFLGVTKLRNTGTQKRVSAHVKSDSRKKVYTFHLIRLGDEYKVQNITFCKVREFRNK